MLRCVFWPGTAGAYANPRRCLFVHRDPPVGADVHATLGQELDHVRIEFVLEGVDVLLELVHGPVLPTDKALWAMMGPQS